jgi:ribulose-phosphate 3-epimerase
VTERTIKLAPSILAADFTRLGEQMSAAEAAGADYLHIDVMDGHFVPNITIGPMIVRACKRVTRLPLDVHLMISAPERYLDAFIEAGADILTIHAEATPHVHRALEAIRSSGTRAGLALNPLTPLAILEEALPYCDLALIMSVNPGFGGQQFIESSLRRLVTAADLREDLNPHCELEVDGGIDRQTAPRAVEAGADVLVAGSSVFGGMDSVEENMAALRQSIASAEPEDA